MPYGETPYPTSKKAREHLFDQIITAGRTGKSHAQMAKEIGISRETLKTWLADHADLAQVMSLADDYALAWWEGLGQRQAETREGNSSVFMFIMKNRFEKDYGKDAPPEPAQPLDVTPLSQLSPKARDKMRKLLRREMDPAK